MKEKEIKPEYMVYRARNLIILGLISLLFVAFLLMCRESCTGLRPMEHWVMR